MRRRKMRQVQVQLPIDRIHRAIELVAHHEGKSPVVWPVGIEEKSSRCMLLAFFPNHRTGGFIHETAIEIPGAEFVLVPAGVLPVQTPIHQFDRHVKHVSHRSTLELVLSSLQSIGSWKGLVLYAFFSGIIAAYGVVTNTSYLLIAAMLIAPMGAPAMVCTIATAIGDTQLFIRGAVRFLVSVVILVLTAMLIGPVFHVMAPTTMMEQITRLSGWTFLLALVGGAAGAQSQVQSERDSLVSGTTAGFLVAVSLSPSSAVVGLGVWLHRWDFVGIASFLVVMTFFGVIAGGWLVLSGYRIRPETGWMNRAGGVRRVVLVACAILVTMGLVVWQQMHPVLLKADKVREVDQLVYSVLQGMPEARFLESTVQFVRTRDSTSGPECLLIRLVIEQSDADRTHDDIAREIRDKINQEYSSRTENPSPYISVMVVPGSERPR